MWESAAVRGRVIGTSTPWLSAGPAGARHAARIAKVFHPRSLHAYRVSSFPYVAAGGKNEITRSIVQ